MPWLSTITHLQIKSNSSCVSWIFSSWNQLWISCRSIFLSTLRRHQQWMSHRLRQTHKKLSGHKHSLCVVTLRCGEAWNLISLQWRLSAATHSVRVLNCVGGCCCCWTHTCQQTRSKLFYFTQRGSEVIYVEQKIQGAVCTEFQHHFISIHTWKYMQYDKFVSSPSNWFLQGIWAHLTRVI